MNYKSQTLSAIVITENNVSTLERCLSSLHWVDQLIVVDRGSTDGSIALARSFSDNVHFHPSGNLSIVRRDALTLGVCDWLLLIEPDEWVEEMLKHEIDGVLLNTNPNMHGYSIPRQLKFQGQWLNQSEPERFLRLVRREQWTVLDNWAADLSVKGESSNLDRPLGYAPYMTLEDYFADLNRRSTMAAYRHLDSQGASAWDGNLFNLIWQTKWRGFQALILQGGLFQGFSGLLTGMAAAFETFLTYAKIRMLTRKA